MPELADGQPATTPHPDKLPICDAGALPWVGVSLAIFVLACILPALEFVSRHGEVYAFSGFDVLVRGWAGPLKLQFAWYANPFLFVGWLSLLWWRPAKALVCGLIALGLSFLTYVPFAIPQIGDELTCRGPLAGYVFWTGSIIVLITGSVIGLNSPRQRPHSNPCPKSA